MEKDKIFFGDSGLSSTSANHIANMAKEMYQTIENELAKFNFYDTRISAMNSDGEGKLLSSGKGNGFMNSASVKINDIAELKSLIAWIREALKARERMLEELKLLSMTDYCTIKGCEVPKLSYEGLVEPQVAIPMTEDDYYATLSIEKRNRYYELETKAATLGKYIHDKGTIAMERASLKEKVEKPTLLVGSDASALLYQYKPTVSIEEVDELFFQLQAQHREYQKELNAMKAACERTCQEYNMKAQTEYTKAYDAYQMEVKRRGDDYRGKRALINAEMSEYMTAESKRIMDLKIVIPDSLKAIYEKVNKIGK